MIKKLRRRIISTTMVSLIITMAVLVIVVNTLTTITNNSTADETIDRYYYIAQYLRKNAAENNFEVSVDGTDNIMIIDESEHSWQHYIIVWYRSDGSREMTFIGSNFITQENALEYIKRAENKNRNSGWLENFRYGKFVEEDGSGYLIICDEITERSRIDSMFQSSVITSVVCIIAMLVIAILFSQRATMPVEKALENQKRFVTDASHELKTPITIISANNDILELNNGEDSLTQSNRTQLDRMSTLIQKMIEMSRYDENTEEIERERFSLGEAVYDTAMSFAPIIEKCGKELEIKLDQDVQIVSDEAKVRQLIAILMDNAVKYSDENGKILLHLTKVKKPVLQIENSCSNVDKIPLNALFERFYREDKVRTGGGGHGLGLSIAKSICEACDFDIKVKQSGISRIMFTVKF